MSDQSGIYTLLYDIADALFTFVPVVIGYTSAKKFNMDPMLGLAIGAVISPFGGIMLDKFMAKIPIMLGVFCSFVATLFFVILFRQLTYQMCMFLYFIYSLGIGLVVGNTMTVALSQLSKKLQADGNAMIQTLMQLSGGIGTSICAAILSFLQQGNNLVAGTKIGSLYVFIFLVITVLLVIGCQCIAFKGGKN